MPHLNHIATSDTEQSKTKVFVTLRRKKKEWNIHSLSLALTLILQRTHAQYNVRIVTAYMVQYPN